MYHLVKFVLKFLHLIAIDDIIFFLMYGDVSNSKFVCKIK